MRRGKMDTVPTPQSSLHRRFPESSTPAPPTWRPSLTRPSSTPLPRRGPRLWTHSGRGRSEVWGRSAHLAPRSHAVGGGMAAKVLVAPAAPASGSAPAHLVLARRLWDPQQVLPPAAGQDGEPRGWRVQWRWANPGSLSTAPPPTPRPRHGRAPHRPQRLCSDQDLGSRLPRLRSPQGGRGCSLDPQHTCRAPRPPRPRAPARGAVHRAPPQES